MKTVVWEDISIEFPDGKDIIIKFFIRIRVILKLPFSLNTTR
ncbi:MAG: hypothetical protein WA421_09375 [Nitrososphaeraceae archaeon]